MNNNIIASGAVALAVAAGAVGFSINGNAQAVESVAVEGVVATSTQLQDIPVTISTPVVRKVKVTMSMLISRIASDRRMIAVYTSDMASSTDLLNKITPVAEQADK